MATAQQTDELPPAPALGADDELICAEDWQRLGLPVPRDMRGILEVTHGLLRDDGQG